MVTAAGDRRRGIGSELMKELIAIARERKLQAIFLEVRESNAAARSLYRKFKFSEGGRRKNYYAKPTEDAVLYSFNFDSCLDHH